MNELSRPLGVTLLGILFILGGILGVVSGIILSMASLLFFFLVILGLIMMAAGAGFFLRCGWSWILAIIVMSISIISEIGLVLMGKYLSVFALIFHIVIVLYLFKGRVRAYFSST